MVTWLHHLLTLLLVSLVAVHHSYYSFAKRIYPASWAKGLGRGFERTLGKLRICMLGPYDIRVCYESNVNLACMYGALIKPQ